MADSLWLSHMIFAISNAKIILFLIFAHFFSIVCEKKTIFALYYVGVHNLIMVFYHLFL